MSVTFLKAYAGNQIIFSGVIRCCCAYTKFVLNCCGKLITNAILTVVYKNGLWHSIKISKPIQKHIPVGVTANAIKLYNASIDFYFLAEKANHFCAL